MTKVQKVILGECIRVMRGVQEKQQFSSFYFVGLVNAAEQAMAGNEEFAVALYAVATNQSVETTKALIEQSL